MEKICKKKWEREHSIATRDTVGTLRLKKIYSTWQIKHFTTTTKLSAPCLNILPDMDQGIISKLSAVLVGKRNQK